MPARNSFARDAVVDAAFKIVKVKGWDRLSARSLAKELNCSTMPIYSYLKSMKRLNKELGRRAIDLLLTYQTTPRTGHTFLDMGLGYVLFAKRERNLFRFLFAGNDRRGGQSNAGKALKEFAFKDLIPKMKEGAFLEGLNEQQLESILTKMWIFTHGLAFLVNNNAFARDNENYIREILEETGLFIIQGEKQKQNLIR